LANQVAGYEVTNAVVEDATLPCLRARRPERLGAGAPVTVWILGPVARLPWTAAKARISSFAAVRAAGLPSWLEAGIGERDQRPVIFVSAEAGVTGTLAFPPAELDIPARLLALAKAARGAHALHEHGLLHAAICPQAVALCEDGTAVLAPPALADGNRLLAQVGYPPLAYIDPQLLRGSGGRWSDVWALGATAHHVVTGSAPFQGLDDVPVVQALSRQLESPPPVLAPLPTGVAELLGRCLAVDPAARPQTAAEVADALEQAASQWAGPGGAGGAGGA
jgi:hypothetical protein